MKIMIKKQNYNNDNPTFYIIPTPIGNLEDMTYRAIRVLKEVDLVLAEDTRVTRKLFSHYDIKTHLESFHDFNEDSKISEIIKKLQNGLNIGLVSDAGMPLISDPGYKLIRKLSVLDINIVALPGSNALLPGLVMSGLKAQPFIFFGFLDHKKNKRIDTIEKLKYYSETLVFYESIHRINDTLNNLFSVLGDRKFSLIREISKTYEEIIRGNLSEFSDLPDLKGELVLVVEGYNEDLINSNLTIVEQVDYFINQGLRKTEAMKKVSQMTKIPKNKIYQDYLNAKIKE